MFVQIERPDGLLHLPMCHGCCKVIREHNEGNLIQKVGSDKCETYHKECSPTGGSWLPLGCLLRNDQRMPFEIQREKDAELHKHFAQLRDYIHDPAGREMLDELMQKVREL